MKLLLSFLLAAVVSSTPYYSNEQFDYFNDNVELNSDSESSEINELSLAQVKVDDLWRHQATSYMNSLRAKAKLDPLKLDSKISEGAQAWAEKIKCSGLQHDQSFDGFSAENLAGPVASGSPNDQAKAGIDMWYMEYKKYDCREVTSLNSYYEKVGHYMNMMGKQYNMVGFGIALCPGKTNSVVVARFNSDTDFQSQVYTAELDKQGLTWDDVNNMNIAGFVPCPSTFSP